MKSKSVKSLFLCFSGAVVLGACGSSETESSGSSASLGGASAENPHYALAMHPEPVQIGTGGNLGVNDPGAVTVMIRSDQIANCVPSSQPALPECSNEWWVGLHLPSEKVVPGTYALASDGVLGFIYFRRGPEGDEGCADFGPVYFTGGTVQVVAVDDGSVTVRVSDTTNDFGLDVPVDGTYVAPICN